MTRSLAFTQCFEQLRTIMATYKEEFQVVCDEQDNFFLNTHFVMKNSKPLYFGSVKINKNYVSYHLMPVYVFPALLQGLSPELGKRMQGKSCFNFTAADRALFDEIKTLTHKGYMAYKTAGYV